MVPESSEEARQLLVQGGRTSGPLGLKVVNERELATMWRGDDYVANEGAKMALKRQQRELKQSRLFMTPITSPIRLLIQA